VYNRQADTGPSIPKSVRPRFGVDLPITRQTRITRGASLKSQKQGMLLYFPLTSHPYSEGEISMRYWTVSPVFYNLQHLCRLLSQADRPKV
jgi:hypothetical protein